MFLNQVKVSNNGELNFIQSYFEAHGSFIPMIGYVLMFAAGIVGLIFLKATILEEQKKFIYYGAAIALVIASLLVLMEGAFITMSINQEGVSAQLLFAPIFASVVSIISALMLCLFEIMTNRSEEKE